MKSRKSYVGQKFNSLTILSDSKDSIDGRRCVNVLCDCGNTKSMSLKRIKEGLKDCGHNNNKNKYDENKLIGKIYGDLTIIEYINDIKNHKTFKCVCICGKEIIRTISSINRTKKPNCGCNRITTKTHGMGKTSEYKSWQGAKERCYKKNRSGYHQYGGRGITMCDRWLNSYENFYEDMGKKPTKQHSLDRIDLNGNYEPSNCRWATSLEQSNNKTDNSACACVLSISLDNLNTK